VTVFVHEYVTGGGLAGAPLPRSWAAEGSAMRRAIAADFAAVAGVRIVATLDARLGDERAPWATIRVGPGEEPETFARLAAEADYTVLIAPETGGVLRERARTIERVGGRSLGPTPEAIELTGDKLRLAGHLDRHSIATPVCRRVAPAEGLPADFAYPAVLKPIDGAGSVDTYYIEGPDACPAEARAMAEAILQPFIPGLPMSASFLFGADDFCLLLGLARQHMEWRGCRFAYRGGTILPDSKGWWFGDPWDLNVYQMHRTLLGLRGFVGVDYLWEPRVERAIVLEVNPRLTTSFVGFARRFTPGSLARTWLAALDPERPADGWRADDRVDALTVAYPGAIRFDADGTIHAEECAP
jgi:tyramine---L-glutamate ligase